MRISKSLLLAASLFALTQGPQAGADEIRVGTIFSSAQSSAQSFLRFYNSGTSAGTATVTLQDNTTGETLGQYQTPSVPAGAELQYLINTVEDGTGATFTKPQYYTVVVDPTFSGAFQHVLWKPSDGTLTNLSTCAGTVSASISTLIGVHSTLLDNGYPSTVAVTNTGVTAATVELGVYDARDGSSLGTYTTASIPIGGQVLLPVSTIEAGIGVTPTEPMYHYNIRVENAFNGFLQHMVNNTQVAVITDMTAQCTLTATTGTPTSSFEGVVSGANDESGTLSVTVQADVETIASAPVSASMKAPANVENQQAILSASGTFESQSGGSVSLSGSYDSTTGSLSLSGGDYAFTGSLDTNNGNQVLSGTYSGPNGNGGFAAERQSYTNLTAAYCGTWNAFVDGGFVFGTWNFTVSSSGSLTGRTANKVDGDNQTMRGTSRGGTASGTTTDGTTFQGTFDSSDFTGTFNSDGDTGNITGSRC